MKLWVLWFDYRGAFAFLFGLRVCVFLDSGVLVGVVDFAFRFGVGQLPMVGRCCLLMVWF